MFTFRRFLALFRPELYTPYELGLRALAQHRYAEALSRFEDLLAGESLSSADRVAAENKRGVTLIHLDRRTDARDAFERALAIDPRYAPSLVNVGNLHLESGDAEAAIRYYERAVRSDEEYAPAHHNLGVAYKRLGRTGDAVRELRRAGRLEGRVNRKQRRTPE